MSKSSKTPIIPTDLGVALKKLQQLADSLYGRLPVERAFPWFIEEVGEFARSLRTGDSDNMKEELGQVMAWVLCLSNILEIDLAAATELALSEESERQLKKYGQLQRYGGSLDQVRAVKESPLRMIKSNSNG